jgi:hypothetical protein
MFCSVYRKIHSKNTLKNDTKETDSSTMTRLCSFCIVQEFLYRNHITVAPTALTHQI